MYLEHFGLREHPFSITPDTEYFFSYGPYQEALNVLLLALRSGEGFIKITGEVGTGKSMLCRKLLNSLDDQFVTAYIPNPYLTPIELRVALAEELKIRVPFNAGPHKLLTLITKRLMRLKKAGKSAVLCIDEAQAIPEETMESLRLLTNLETEKSKLLQIVLLGQPELDIQLNKKSVRQLKQRITFSYNLKPLDRTGLTQYLEHRLKIAGYTGGDMFEHAAINQLHRSGRGIPRLLNILCHKAMLVAYGRGTQQVSREHMRIAIRDTEDAQLITRLQKVLNFFLLK